MIRDKSISNYHRYLTRVYFNTRKKHTFCSMTLKQIQNKIYTFTETKNFSKKILSRNGGQALALAGRRPAPHFFERDFSEGFTPKNRFISWNYIDIISWSLYRIVALKYIHAKSDAALNESFSSNSISDSNQTT